MRVTVFTNKCQFDQIFCFRFLATLNGGYFSTSYSADYNTWIHVGYVFRGPSNGQGIRVYKDGIYENAGSQKASWSTGTPSGVLKIGRLFEGSDAKYSRAQVDELMFWNRQLSEDEIRTIKNTASWAWSSFSGGFKTMESMSVFLMV